MAERKFHEDRFVEGLDVNNWWTLKVRDVVKAEAKNHNPEIQFVIAKMYGSWFSNELVGKLHRQFFWRYLFDAEKRYDELHKEKRRLHLEWMEKAAAQNFGPAEYAMAKRYEHKYDAEDEPEKFAETQTKANEYFLRAIEHGDEKAMCDMAVRYWDGEGTAVNKEAAQKLIDALTATEIYECSFFEGSPRLHKIHLLENIRRINAELYRLMFAVYDRVQMAKRQIDKLLTSDGGQNSKYDFLHGYKLTGKIKYDFDESEPLAATYKNAECEWTVTATYDKPLANRMDAQHLTRNYHEGLLADFTHDYFCYATYCFLHSTKSNVPGQTAFCFSTDEFKRMKREKFYGEVSLKVAEGYRVNEREAEAIRVLGEKLGVRVGWQ